ncbi:MAG: glycosyltransferase family 2 protein [Gammaproteobacteria bacterium]|nr:glycosyltransferase family 2 protein [Gammaproteobacteria bacterium]
MLLEQRVQALQEKNLYISCIVPVYNEEANIATFLSTLTNKLKTLTNRFEIIVVDDGSRDGTVLQVMQQQNNSHIRLLGFSRNFGKEIALTAGLEHCKGDVAILLDGDFQHPIDMLSTFLQRWSEGYDMVYGVRRNRNTDSRVRRGLAHMFYHLMAKITRIDMPAGAGDFRLLDRKVIDALNAIPERTRFMKGLYAWVGFNKIAVPFDVSERRAGKSGWGFMRLTELALTGITSFSNVPLRVWGFAGVIISLLSLIYAIYIVTVTLIYGADLPGFPSIIVAVMFFGGIQLLSIGILGEYIARIFTEVKHRPSYIVAIKQGFEV